MFALTPFYGFDRPRGRAHDRQGGAVTPFRDDILGFPSGFNNLMPYMGDQDIPASIKVDLSETETDVMVAADVPAGFTKEDLKLDVNNSILTIVAETSSSGQENAGDGANADSETPDEPAAMDEAGPVKHHLRERTQVHRNWAMHKKVSRSIRLPATVDASKATASFEDGALHIQMPKVHAVNSISIA